MDERLELVVELQKKVSEQKSIIIQLKQIPQKIESLEADKLECQAKKRREEELISKKEADIRHAEAELKDQTSHKEKLDSQLNQIKNNKEYQAMLKEIEGTQRKIDQAQEFVAQVKDDVSTRQSRLKEEIDKEIEADLQDIEEHIQALQKEHETLPERVKVLRSEQDLLRQQIPKELLAKIDQLLKVRDKLAVVPCNDGHCGGCQAKLPPQILNLAKRGLDLLYCEGCSRLLYWDPDKE